MTGLRQVCGLASALLGGVAAANSEGEWRRVRLFFLLLEPDLILVWECSLLSTCYVHDCRHHFLNYDGETYLDGSSDDFVDGFGESDFYFDSSNLNLDFRRRARKILQDPGWALGSGWSCCLVLRIERGERRRERRERDVDANEERSNV